MFHGRWPNGWTVIDVSRWFESNFDFPARLAGKGALRFVRRFGDNEGLTALANNQPEADKSLPEPKLDKQVAEMLGTLKSHFYAEGNLDNSCGGDTACRDDFSALIESHHGTRFLNGGISASILDELSSEGAKLLGDGEAALVATDLGKLFLLVDGNGEAGFQPGQDFIIPLGSLPPADLGPPPVI